MTSIKVKDFMVPISQYATVSQEDTLGDALLALEQAQMQLDQNREKHRAILVYNERGRIIGKLNLWDMIKGVEPGYKKLNYPRETSPFGTGPEFIKSLLKTYGLWRRPIDEICRQGGKIKVKDIMHSPSPEEYIEEDASLDEAINQLVLGRHLSLLVNRGDEIVGILRLSDIFKEIRDRIQSCTIGE